MHMFTSYLHRKCCKEMLFKAESQKRMKATCDGIFEAGCSSFSLLYIQQGFGDADPVTQQKRHTELGQTHPVRDSIPD